MTTECNFCSNPLNTREPGNGEYFTGWSMNGDQRIKRKLRTGVWAHGACINGEKYSSDQLSMEEFLQERTNERE